MSDQKATIDRYMQGFRESDHAVILDCLTEDVVWEIKGHTTLTGKEAFDGEIANDAFEGSPVLTVERTIEDGNVVAVNGTGEGTMKTGQVFRFAFCTIFTFAGEKVGRVESFICPLLN